LALPFRIGSLALVAALLALAGSAQAGARVALLPIDVHAAGAETAYLRKGLGEMLASRLEQYDGISVLRIDAGEEVEPGAARAVEAARSAGADYVLYGSFTRFGEGASLDLRCAAVGAAAGPDAPEPDSRRVFIHSGTLAEIIPQLDTLAEKVARYASEGRADRRGAVPEAAAVLGDSDELEALRRRVDALERAVYSPVAAGASPPDEPAPDDGSGSVVR
jgi:outer membrane protein insertion porin family